jgi:hypothetical protein
MEGYASKIVSATVPVESRRLLHLGQSACHLSSHRCGLRCIRWPASSNPAASFPIPVASRSTTTITPGIRDFASPPRFAPFSPKRKAASARNFATLFALFATLVQKNSRNRLTPVYRETRGWLRGCLRVGDVPFPAGNYHCILVPDLGRASKRRKAGGALSVVDPAELRLAVCLSRRYDPIAGSFGNQSDGYSGPEGTAAGVINSRRS